MLWSAYAVSTYGTWLAFGAFPLIAVRVLHASTLAVSLLAASELGVGAILALPLGPWVEFRHKRPVMVSMDIVRFLAMASIPAAYLAGVLSFVQLIIVSAITEAADITFSAASGAYLRKIVDGGLLLKANARFESTMWTATAIGPPLGGAVVGIFGPVITVASDAASYLLSALSIFKIQSEDVRTEKANVDTMRLSHFLEGWRRILRDPPLRALFLNNIAVNGLIIATGPLLTVLLLRQLGLAPWQYGMAFGLPCVGGWVGSRLSSGLVRAYGQRNILLAFGVLRVAWPVMLVFVHRGIVGFAVVVGIEFALITCASIFNPVFATYRLTQIDRTHVSRILSTWSVSGNVVKALVTVIAGVAASFTGPRLALGALGLALLLTPLSLPWGLRTSRCDDMGGPVTTL